MKKNILAMVTAGALALFAACPAKAQNSTNNEVLFGITFFQNQLISIDTTTGEGTLVGNIGETVSGYGLAAYQNKLYTFNPNDQSIDQLNLVNGKIFAKKTITGIGGAGGTGLAGEGDLAINPDTGVGFLASAFDSAGDPTHPLYTFNLTTGLVTPLATTTVALDGLAFDGAPTLYAIGQGDVNGGDPAAGDATLYTVNQTTGALTTIGVLGVPQNSPVAGITFAPDGTLYGAIDDQLYKIDKATGAATKVDADTPDFSFSSVSGLAYATGANLLGNMSSRANVGTGDKVAIGGFIIRPQASSAPSPAPATKQLVIRALGPSLTAQDISGVLADPTLTLYDNNGMQIAFNDNWTQNSAADRTTIQDAGLAPIDAKESVIVADIAVGSYTAIVRGADNGTGLALTEVYDLAPGNGLTAANLSTRAFVDTGDNVLIDGVIISGSGAQPVIIRGIGPSLEGQVPTPLADPTLELHDANGALVQSNDNWMDSPQKAAIQASGIAPTNDLESAIDLPLGPGNYTAILRGKGNTTGIGLVEVYNP